MDDYREVGGVNTLREEGRIKELKSTLSFKSKISQDEGRNEVKFGR